MTSTLLDASTKTKVYRGMTEIFTLWCNNNNLKFNICKTKEPVVDHQRNRMPPVPVIIQGQEVERVEYLEVPCGPKQ